MEIIPSLVRRTGKKLQDLATLWRGGRRSLFLGGQEGGGASAQVGAGEREVLLVGELGVET